jgi:hypothetical protein
VGGLGKMDCMAFAATVLVEVAELHVRRTHRRCSGFGTRSIEIRLECMQRVHNYAQVRFR